MRKVFVFDGDDTSWMNGWQYSAPQAEFFAYIYRIFADKSPDLHTLKGVYFQNANALFKTWGVKRGRVAEEMLATYREVCEWVLCRFGENMHSEEHEEHIRILGDRPFDYTQLRWLPEAREVLRQLKEGGAVLALLTSYDRSVFPKRAEFLNVHEFFPPDRVLVTEFRKTKEDFTAVSGWTQEEDAKAVWYAVGNSKSDILPALEISENWRGVYVPFGSTSAYVGGFGGNGFFAPLDKIHERSVTIPSFREFFTAI